MLLQRSLRQLPSQARRCYSAVQTENLLKRLAQNAELDEKEARAELRWITQNVEDRLSKGIPSVAARRTDFLAPEALAEARDESVQEAVERRAAGEPLQYVLGTTDFGPLTLLCRAPTLIPRPETAHLTTLLAQRILHANPTSDYDPLHILDLCTGSIPIPLLLSHHLDRYTRKILCVDSSPQAIALSLENLALYPAYYEKIRFRNIDLFSPRAVASLHPGRGRKYHLITCNPPYISLEDYERLPASVKRYEDPRALLGDPDDSPLAGKLGYDGKGLAFYRRIASMLPDLLQEETIMQTIGWGGIPRVMFEIGENQADDVKAILLAASGKDKERTIKRVEVWKDQFGKDRGVVGWTT
ncbi:hypothetical protein P7C73_g1712, partial [Tremellales sp. Uapishka_1]